MKIKMTKTAPGADNGHDTREYIEGEEYDVGEALAKAFCDEMKVAVRAGEARSARPAKKVAQ